MKEKDGQKRRERRGRGPMTGEGEISENRTEDLETSGTGVCLLPGEMSQQIMLKPNCFKPLKYN